MEWITEYRCVEKHVIPVKAESLETVKTLPKTSLSLNPLRPNSDLSQTSHCNIRGLSVSEVMRIENVITQVQFY